VLVALTLLLAACTTDKTGASDPRADVQPEQIARLSLVTRLLVQPGRQVRPPSWSV